MNLKLNVFEFMRIIRKRYVLNRLFGKQKRMDEAYFEYVEDIFLQFDEEN
jgi:hypothetical protein